MNAGDQGPVPADLMRVMLCDVAEETPVSAAAERIKRNALRRATVAILTVPRQAGWRPFVARTEMKILFDDGAFRSWLVRMQPGSELPPHVHVDGEEECVVLEGEVLVNGLRYGSGDYTVALRGSAHHSVRTETGALFYLRTVSPRAARYASAPAG